MWLLTEYVQPFRTGEEFAKAIGVTEYSVFSDIIYDFEEYKEKDLQSLGKKYATLLNTQEEKYKAALKELNQKYELEIDPRKKYELERDMLLLERDYNRDKKYINTKIENLNSVSKDEVARNFITRIFSLMQRGLLAGDIDWKHFGRVANGEIKLYDYGFSKKVFDKHYRRRSIKV